MTKKVTPRKSTMAKYREFADLYRGGPDHCRGDAAKCYKEMHPRASKKVCEAQGSRYFNNEHTQQYLQEATSEVAKRADVTQERILQELACLGFYDIRKLFNDDGSPKAVSELDDDTARAIVGLDAVNIGNSEAGVGQILKLKLADKRSALVDMGKHIGMFKERIEHTGKDGGPIETKELTDNEVARRMAFLLTKAAKNK